MTHDTYSEACRRTYPSYCYLTNGLETWHWRHETWPKTHKTKCRICRQYVCLRCTWNSNRTITQKIRHLTNCIKFIMQGTWQLTHFPSVSWLHSACSLLSHVTKEDIWNMTIGSAASNLACPAQTTLKRSSGEYDTKVENGNVFNAIFKCLKTVTVSPWL